MLAVYVPLWQLAACVSALLLLLAELLDPCLTPRIAGLARRAGGYARRRAFTSTSRATGTSLTRPTAEGFSSSRGRGAAWAGAGSQDRTRRLSNGTVRGLSGDATGARGGNGAHGRYAD